MKKQKSSFRWVVFFSVLFTYLIISSQRTAPGLITDQVMVDFGISAATIGILTSFHFFVYTGLQIPMGLFADRFGPNFFLIAGALLTGIGTVLYSIGTHETILFLARILMGIGDATIWVNMMLIMGQWFSAKEFTRLIGVAGMTGSLGFLLATVPYSALINLVGWRSAFLYSGIVILLCSVLLYIVLVKKPNQPFFINNNNRYVNVLVILKKIFTNRQAWVLFCCHFGIVGGYIGFIGSWAVPYGMEMYGMSRMDASQLIMISLVGALIGAPIISWFSSKIGTIKKPYLFFYALHVLSWSLFLFFHGNPPNEILEGLFFLIGICFGSNSLTFAAVRQFFPKEEAGIISGIANTGGFLSAVLLPSIFGYILEYCLVSNFSDGYYYGFIAPVVFAIVGFIAVCLLKEKRIDGE